MEIRHLLSGRLDVRRDETGVITVRHSHELGTDRLILSYEDGQELARILTKLTGLSPRLRELVDRANAAVDFHDPETDTYDEEAAASHYAELALAFATALTTEV